MHRMPQRKKDRELKRKKKIIPLFPSVPLASCAESNSDHVDDDCQKLAYRLTDQLLNTFMCVCVCV